MKITTIVALFLAGLSVIAFADDFGTPTPTPTPYYLGRPGRHGPAWQEQVVRRNERRTAAESRHQARAEEKAGRTAAGTAQVQAREAAREKAEAQRQLAEENHREARAEKPELTSDLMRRMGFSEQEIAAQKAREQKPAAGAINPTEAASPGH